jgi:hypothetical protein
LVAGELDPQSGHRGGVIMCRRRDSASLVFFALDYRLKSIERRGIAVNCHDPLLDVDDARCYCDALRDVVVDLLLQVGAR